MSAAANARITTLAADRAVHRAFAWLHLHEPQIRRWQLEFLAIPAPPFGEQDRAAWFLDRFHDLGLQNPHIDEAGNALAELQSAGAPTNAPCILLSAHLDTVFPPGTDCTPREDGAQILGPGATDNGAGLAALLALAAALQHAELAPATTILFAANTGEEGPGDLRGMRQIFAGPYKDHIRAAIALEGAGDTAVVDRALGSRRLRATITGPGGHSWADAGRPNPIFALATALAAIARIKLPANPRTTLSCGVIAGGTSVNSIPEAASADLDIRSTSALELDRTELAVLKTLASAVTHADLRLDVQRIGDRPSGAHRAHRAACAQPAGCRPPPAARHGTPASARPTPICRSRSVCPRWPSARVATAGASTRCRRATTPPAANLRCAAYCYCCWTLVHSQPDSATSSWV